MNTLSEAGAGPSADVKTCVLELIACSEFEDTRVVLAGVALFLEALVRDTSELVVASPAAVLEQMLLDRLCEISGSVVVLAVVSAGPVARKPGIVVADVNEPGAEPVAE